MNHHPTRVKELFLQRLLDVVHGAVDFHQRNNPVRREHGAIRVLDHTKVISSCSGLALCSSHLSVAAMRFASSKVACESRCRPARSSWRYRHSVHDGIEVFTTSCMCPFAVEPRSTARIFRSASHCDRTCTASDAAPDRPCIHRAGA